MLFHPNDGMVVDTGPEYSDAVLRDVIIYHIHEACIDQCKITRAIQNYTEVAPLDSTPPMRRALTMAQSNIRANISQPCHKPKLML